MPRAAGGPQKHRIIATSRYALGFVPTYSLEPTSRLSMGPSWDSRVSVKVALEGAVAELRGGKGGDGAA